MPKEDKSEYQIGDMPEGGSKIYRILGAYKDFIVYLISPTQLRWEKNDQYSPTEYIKKVSRFNVLNAQVESSIVFSKNKSTLKNTLGRALYSAVNDDSEDWESHFNVAHDRILSDCSVFCRAYYVISASIIVMLVVLATAIISLYNLPESDRHFNSAVAAGGIGALLSSLSRIRDIEIPPYSTINRQALHAFVRIVFGATAGFVFVVLIKGELVLPDQKNDSYALFAFSIIAGFSERFLPSLLTKYSENQDAP